MRPRPNGIARGQREERFQSGGPNWILIAGGALLSTLSIRLGCKLKQTFDSRKEANARKEKSLDRRSSPGRHMRSNMYSLSHDDDICFNQVSEICFHSFYDEAEYGARVQDSHDRFLEIGSFLWRKYDQSFREIVIRIGCSPMYLEQEIANLWNESITEVKYPPNDHMSENDGALPLVTVNAPEYSRENGAMWASSLDRLELPPKPFHHSNCSDSPCVSESGSEILTKRDVIQKLRQQLKRRDDMIIEMQDQIMELQNSINCQLAISTTLQSQVDAANKDLLNSEREIQRLRKAIADNCLKHANGDGKPSVITAWPLEVRNGHTNGYCDGDSTFELAEKGRIDVDKVEMLRREVRELKEVLEGKEYLLQSYKEQKSELSMKIKELQQRLDSQLPNIL